MSTPTAINQPHLALPSLTATLCRMADTTADKDMQREQLSAEVEEFLARNGKIKTIPTGETTLKQTVSKGGIIDPWPTWRDYQW